MSNLKRNPWISTLGLTVLIAGLMLAGHMAALAQQPSKPRFISAGPEVHKAITTAAISVDPWGSAETAAVRDIIAAYLMEAGIRVVSDENIARSQEALLRRAEAEAEGEEEEEKARGATPVDREGDALEPGSAEKEDAQEHLDLIAVAKATGAQCIIKVNVIAQGVQQNVYDNENKRVIEVRTESRVSLVTVSVLDTENGDILKIGAVPYADAVAVAAAAEDVGRMLAAQLKGK